jgi:hypothetical protein
MLAIVTPLSPCDRPRTTIAMDTVNLQFTNVTNGMAMKLAK